MRDHATGPVEARAYVDTGPVQERVYAQYAGLGWIGKNTCLINPERGSWLFLAEILCSLPLEPDAPGFDQCGTCTLCLEACPTQAIVEPWVLDATRCVSYLTIELRSLVPEEHRDRLGNHLFGCDICQEVCPWNGVPAKSTQPEWNPKAELDGPRLLDLWRRTDEQLQAIVAGGPLARIGVKGLRRNLAIAMGNSAEPSAAEALQAIPGAPAGDNAVQDPLLADMSPGRNASCAELLALVRDAIECRPCRRRPAASRPASPRRLPAGPRLPVLAASLPQTIRTSRPSHRPRAPPSPGSRLGSTGSTSRVAR